MRLNAIEENNSIEWGVQHVHNLALLINLF